MYTLLNEEGMDLIYQNYKKNSIIFDTTGEKRGGSCVLCERCVDDKLSQARRHPFRARPPMEAVGIDVIAEPKDKRNRSDHGGLRSRWKMPADSS